MGLPMARRLAANDFPLTVWNRTASRAASLTATGTTLAASPQALAADCDVVVTMLSDATATRAVLCGRDGVLSTGRRGAVVVDMSTIGPKVARDIAAEAATHGIDFLDAPVSGSVALAEQGGPDHHGRRSARRIRTCPAVAGCSEQSSALPRARWRRCSHELAVNIVIAATSQSIAEALALAEASGIDRTAAYDTLASSAVSSPFIGYKRQAYLDPDAAPVSFTAGLMGKGLELALEVAGDLPLPVTSTTREFLDASCAAGFWDADFACAAEILRREMATHRASAASAH